MIAYEDDMCVTAGKLEQHDCHRLRSLSSFVHQNERSGPLTMLRCQIGRHLQGSKHNISLGKCLALQLPTPLLCIAELLIGYESAFLAFSLEEIVRTSLSLIFQEAHNAACRKFLTASISWLNCPRQRWKEQLPPQALGVFWTSRL